VDFQVVHHIVKSIGTKKIKVARLHRVKMALHVNLRVNPDRARHEVLVDRVARFFDRDQTTVDLFLQQRVIACHGGEASAP